MPRPERQSRRERSERNNDREQKPIKTIAGRVGNDPEWRKAGDNDVLEFSVAIQNGYGDDAPPPTWVQCTAWPRKPELQDFIEDEIYKGSAVAVEGPFESNVSESDGKTYHKINIVRVGLVDWFKPGDKPAERPAPETARRAREEAAPRNANSRQQAARDDTEDDDLPF